MFLSSQMHNFVHNHGYTMDTGVAKVVENLVLDQWTSPVRPQLTRPENTAGALIYLSKAWAEANVPDLPHDEVERHLDGVVKCYLYYAMSVASGAGRMRIMAVDMLLLRDFSRALLGLRGQVDGDGGGDPGH